MILVNQYKKNKE